VGRDAHIGELNGVLAGKSFEVDPGEVFHGQRGLVQANGEIHIVELVVGPDLVFGDGLFFDVGTGLGISFKRRQIAAFCERGVG